MKYEKLALVYDYLMKDVPYKNWVSHVERERQRFGIDGKRVLDVACGTGIFSIMLAQEGYDVTGVDLSGDMLMIAREKAEKASVDLPLFEQNMKELEGLGEYDLITIFCDSLNYLQSPEEVKETFKSIAEHLVPNGLFMFDVHTPFKITDVYQESTFTLVEDEVSYIWDCFQGEVSLSVEHELTLFVLDEHDERYDRFEEFHVQRTYPLKDYEAWLKEAGFEVVALSADFTDASPSSQSERAFFTCKKVI